MKRTFFFLLFILLFHSTHHMRCTMNRKTPGTTRSSLPTLQRRRNTTIPGISRRVVVAAFVVVVFHPTNRRPRTHLTRESPRDSLDLSGDRGKRTAAIDDDADVDVACRADVRTDSCNRDSSYRVRCPFFSGLADDAARRRDGLLLDTTDSEHCAARRDNARPILTIIHW